MTTSNTWTNDASVVNRLKDTLSFLSSHAPFDHMSQSHLMLMAGRMKLGFYAQDEVIASPDQGLATCCYIVMQGSVVGEQMMSASAQGSVLLTTAECFPLGALLAKRPVASVYRARENTFCLELAAKDFYELLEMSPAFNDFCTRRIANLLEHSKQVLQSQFAQSMTDQHSMSTSLANLLRGEPVCCQPTATVASALQLMNTHALTSIVVAEQNKPVGIFTLRDVLVRVALVEGDSVLQKPISALMTPNPIMLPSTSPAYEALLKMTRHAIYHILVVDEEGHLVGMLSERDLFALQRLSLGQVNYSILNATELEHLKQATQDIRTLTKNMLAQGVPAEQLIGFISTLKTSLVQRVLALHLGNVPYPQVHYCWVTFASAGRDEQTLNTIQTNAIIYENNGDTPNERVLAWLLQAAQKVNNILAECDFPFKPNRALAGQADYCLTIEAWQEKMTDLFTVARETGELNAEWFDLQAVAGDARLAEQLRTYMIEQIEVDRDLLKTMANTALLKAPPLELPTEEEVDLKRSGVVPFVDAVRLYSLAFGVNAQTTAERLRQVATKLKLNSEDVANWLDAFYFIEQLRIREQSEYDDNGAHDHVAPEKLSDLDQRILKESFRQVRKLQARLAEDVNSWE